MQGRRPRIDTPRKRKWAAGLLSALFPGIGHMYAGAMQRGLFFMLLLAGNIFGVVLVSIEGIVPLIVLLSVLIPVIYVYALFDALQTTERMNAQAARPAASEETPKFAAPARENWLLLVLGGIGVFAFFALDGSERLDTVLDGNGALIAAGAFILAGVFVFLSGAGKK